MLLVDKIKQLLKQYNKSRGFFHFLFRDPPAIKALRKLNAADKNNILKVYQCFVENLPIEEEAAYLVYKEIMDHITEKWPLDYTINLLNFLIKENLTTQTISNFVPVFQRFNYYLACLNYLKNSQILTLKNLDDIMEHNFFAIFLILNKFSKIPDFGPLSQEMLDLLKQSSDSALLMLNRLVILHPPADFINLQSLARLLQLPDDSLLLTDAAFEVVWNRIPTHWLVRLLQLPNNSFLLTNAAFEIVWNRIPTHLLTQAVFDQLIRLSQQRNPQQQIRRYVNQLIGVRENQVELDREVVVNDQQSTHRGSVHQSVSDSASRLFTLYSLMIEGNRLQETLEMIQHYIMQLPEDSIKNTAAKTCVERIIKFEFTDPGSGVTIPQLMALSFTAIHDHAKRIGDLSDAREQFVEGLYEIQRGYNLSENGHDQGGPDTPICTRGTFNKLIEKLEGIHPDVEVLHITPANASLKLPIVVREVALDYLSSLAQPQTIEELERFTQLIEQLRQDECVDIIWDHIKPKIIDRMFDEFGSLYSGKADPRLNGLIESGQYLKLENLSRFQQQIVASSGYQHYCSQALRSQPLNFFSEPKATDSDSGCSLQSSDVSRRFGS